MTGEAASVTRRAQKSPGRNVARAGMSAAFRRLSKCFLAAQFAEPNEPRWAWTIDLSSVFTSSSPESSLLLGYAPEEIIGRPVDLVMDSRELARAEAMVNAVGVPEKGLSNLIISAAHRDGSAPWLEVSVRPMTDATGAVVGYCGVSRHIGADAAQVLAAQRARRRIEHLIDNDLLMTAFQPIVDVQTWTIVGVEGLTRFVEDPGAGPALRFADATAVGLGPTLELLAVRTALAAAVRLPTQLYVSVNVSPLTCLESSLPDIIGRSGIDPKRVVLEVTEHGHIADYESLMVVLNRLRASGIRIAVDDVGAGFSSAQRILAMKPDVLKLDRVIVTAIDTEPGQRALVAGLVAFAAHIGAEITAEGVETLGEAKCLRELGVPCLQGYFFGRPTVKAREWATWITPSNRRCRAAGNPLITGNAADQPAKSGLRDDLRATIRWTWADDAGAGHLPGRHTEMWWHGTAPDGGLEVAGLDALPDVTAVLDDAGVIVAANKAWQMFPVHSGGLLDTTRGGNGYLGACSREAAAGSVEALEALIGLRSVLSGASFVNESQYSRETPSGPRWFISRITAIGGTGTGAGVSQMSILDGTAPRTNWHIVRPHDPLTGLVNRLLFGERLADAMPQRVLQVHRPDGGVLYLDLDNFKPINDAAWDELLVLAARRSKVRVRPSDTVGRIGGDEFPVRAPGIRISIALGLPYHIQGTELCVSVSVGRYQASAGDDPDATTDSRPGNVQDQGPWYPSRCDRQSFNGAEPSTSAPDAGPKDADSSLNGILEPVRTSVISSAADRGST